MASNESFQHTHTHYRCVLPNCTSTVDYGSAVNVTPVTFCTAPHCMHRLFILSLFCQNTTLLWAVMRIIMESSLCIPGSHTAYTGCSFLVFFCQNTILLGQSHVLLWKAVYAFLTAYKYSVCVCLPINVKWPTGLSGMHTLTVCSCFFYLVLTLKLIMFFCYFSG